MNRQSGLFVITIPIVFLLGLMAGNPGSWWNSHQADPENSPAEKEQLSYTCPMHPHVHEKQPGECPICGMSLVKTSSAPSVSERMDESHSQVYVDASVINNLGIRTAQVRRGSIARKLRIYGYVNRLGNSNEQIIRAPVSGVVTDIRQKSDTGQYFKGDVMLIIDSPEVLAMQKNYLQAIKKNDVLNIRTLKQKLSILGINFEELGLLVQSQKPSGLLTLRYPQTGHLERIDISPQQSVSAQQVMAVFKPAYAFSSEARVYESQWTWLKPGQKVLMTNRSHPGAQWKGEVRHVEQLSNSSTTSVKLEADFEANPEVVLRTGMQTEMDVYTEARDNVLQVPTSSVIPHGSRSLVIVAHGNGHFQPVDIRPGLSNDEYTEIRHGLDENMRVVVSGQFLIDSASDLNAELSRLNNSPGEQRH